MARIRIAETTLASVPTPPAGKATIFLDSADNGFKAKFPDNSIVLLGVTAEQIQDIVGDFFQDSSTIDIQYNDAGDVISIEVIEGGLDISQIPVIPSGNLISTNLADALNELQSSIDDSDQNLVDHLDGGPNKHDATEIDYERDDIDKKSIQAASDNVEAALTDLDDNKLARDGSQVMTGNLDMDGNDIITGSGTVDGRDVSQDGAKLDTIETNAKDDQDADEVPYDNSTSGLSATEVQGAIDEVDARIDTAESTLSTHLDGGASKHDATEIDYETLDAQKTDIQASSDNVEDAVGDLDDFKLSINGNNSMEANLDMGGNAVINVGNVDGRDVSADGSKLDTIETNAKDDQVASEVPVTPVGNLDANDVQEGLEELQGDIDTINNNFEERAQDAVGATLQDTSTVELTYNDAANQISAIVPNGGITNAQIASGIDAIKIANGSVSNAEFQRLAGITANIQAQLNARLELAGGTMTGNLILNADPTSDLQAATKRYVDEALQGLKSKDSVKVATIAALTLATDLEAGDTVDGTVLVAGDRVLVKNQTNLAENGIYIVQASGAPVRSSDADMFEELVSAYAFVEDGATLANTGWTSTAETGGTLEVDDIPWVQFSSAGIVTADGLGVIKVGNEIQLDLDGGTLSKSGTGLKVSDSGIDTTQLNDEAVTNNKIANLTITNAKIAAAAAIEFSKLQALLANRALVTNASGVITASIITQTELEALDNVTSNIQTQLNDKTPIDHLDGGDNKHDASEIRYQRANLNKVDIQAASDDVENALTDLDDNKLSRTGSQAMTGNLNMGTNNITNVGTVDGRDVSVDGSKLDGIESGATADQIASEVPFTPSGDLVSTNVQAALSELDSEKVPNTRQVNAGTGLSGGGDLSANRTISMPNVGTASAVGAANSSLSITTDAQGRVTAKSAQLISIISSQITDFAATVRSTVLTGLSLATSTAITATDTVLTAFGKLQAQVTILFNRNINSGTGLQGGGNLTADRTLSLTDVGTPGTYGSASQVPVVTTNAQGRVTNVVNTSISGVPAANITNTPAGDIAATNVQAAINELDTGKQPLDSDLTAVAALAGTGFITRTGTGTATTRTIAGTVGNINVSNGDGISGNPTIDLPNVGSSGSVGAANSSLIITTDTKGRVTSRTAQLISIISSQVSNFAATVRTTVLTGYAVGASVAIAATDTILEAFGKVQAQINTLFNRNINSGVGLSGGGNLTADRTLNLTNTGVTAATYGSGGLNVGQFTVDAQGRLTAAQNTPITFGRDYQAFEDTVNNSTTSSAQPLDVAASTFDTTSLSGGNYFIMLQYKWTHSTTGADARFALFIDGVLIGEQVNIELQDATTTWTNQFIEVVNLSAAIHTIELRFGSEGTSTTTVDRVNCYIWRVS